VQEERFGVRDLVYQSWHRRKSLARYIGIEKAALASMIDVDCILMCEIDASTSEPLALIETALDRGQARKGATATKRLAQRAGIPAYTVLFSTSRRRNPADPRAQDILRFRVKRLWPNPEREWRCLTPPEWAAALIRIRAWAACRVDREAANDAQYTLEFDPPFPR
jgi:hypothetical protein